MTHPRPNIVCFITDQQRADHLSCYGNPDIQTPNIDRLAAEGIVFDESYVANPLCMPNRATLFTGLYPKAHGVRENGIGLSPEFPLLPEILRDAGYRTGSFGKLHLVPYSIERHTPPADWEIYETPEYWAEHDTLPLPFYGFDEVYFTGGHGPYTFGHYKYDVGEEHQKLDEAFALVPPTGAKESWKSSIETRHHYNTRIADHTIEFIERQNDDQPFFAWCSFPDPHHPYMPPAPYCDQYDPQTIDFSPARCEGELDNLPSYFREAHNGHIRLGGLAGGAQITDEQYREIIAHTYGMISMVDDQVGRVIVTLEAQDILDNTIIIFMSDHGDLMGDHWLVNKGPFPYRGLLRVPTIWRVPERAATAQHSKAFISSVDFAPTILDFAQVKTDVYMQGQSYRQVIAGDADTIRDSAYIEYDSTYLNDRLRTLRTPEWSITFYADSDDGLLFNLADDPDELDNLWHDPASQSVKQTLLVELLRVSTRQDSWLPAKKSHA